MRKRNEQEKRGYKTSEPEKSIQHRRKKIAYLPATNAFESNKVLGNTEKVAQWDSKRKKMVPNNGLHWST